MIRHAFTSQNLRKIDVYIADIIRRLKQIETVIINSQEIIETSDDRKEK